MALNPYLLNSLCKIIKPGSKIASMGYPDIVVPLDQIPSLDGVDISRVKTRADSAKICARHGKDEFPVPDAGSLTRFGCTLYA